MIVAFAAIQVAQPAGEALAPGASPFAGPVSGMAPLIGFLALRAVGLGAVVLRPSRRPR